MGKLLAAQENFITVLAILAESLPRRWILSCIQQANTIPDSAVAAAGLLYNMTSCCAQIMMALMHNSKQVAAEWQVKSPSDHGDYSCFKCEPEQGILPPGQKQLLKVPSALPCCTLRCCLVSTLFMPLHVVAGTNRDLGSCRRLHAMQCRFSIT